MKIFANLTTCKSSVDLVALHFLVLIGQVHCMSSYFENEAWMYNLNSAVQMDIKEFSNTCKIRDITTVLSFFEKLAIIYVAVIKHTEVFNKKPAISL